MVRKHNASDANGLEANEVEDCNDDHHHHRRPFILGKVTVTAQTKDGRTRRVGGSCCTRKLSHRTTYLRVELPKDLRNVTSLSLKYDRDERSSKYVDLYVRRIYLRKLLPPRLGIFLRKRSETGVLLPGKANSFVRVVPRGNEEPEVEGEGDNGVEEEGELLQLE